LEMGEGKDVDRIPRGVIVISHETLREFVPPLLCTKTLWRELVPQEDQRYTLDQEKKAKEKEAKQAKKAEKKEAEKAKKAEKKEATKAKKTEEKKATKAKQTGDGDVGTRGEAKEEGLQQAQQTAAPNTRKKRSRDEINSKNNEDGDLPHSDGERQQQNKRSRQQSTNEEGSQKKLPTANGSQPSRARVKPVPGKTNQYTSTETADYER